MAVLDPSFTVHDGVRGRLLDRVATFRAERGYMPPCWELVRLAREARK